MPAIRFAGRAAASAGPWGGIRPVLWLALLLPFLIGAPAPAESPPLGEYRIKAALLHKLGRFVQWPDRAFAGAGAPLAVCVLGDDPFGPALDLLADRKVNSHPVEVVRLAAGATGVDRCHILFVAASERLRLGGLLKTLGQRPIFTVSDIEGFARRGGMLQMYTAATRIRFVINRGSAERTGLRIAAPLLDLAEIVGQADTGED